MKRAIRNDHAEGTAAREATGSTMRLPVEPQFGMPPQRDAFGLQGLAERLAILIHGVGPPYAISISGEWGIGKTTLIHQMPDALRKLDREPLAVELDLWSEEIDDLRRSTNCLELSQLRITSA